MQDINLKKIFREVRESISPDEGWLNLQRKKFSSKQKDKFTITIPNLFFNSLSMNKKLMALVVTGAVCLTGLVGLPVAAQAKGVGPGHTLYPVDLALENVELAFTSEEGDVVLLAEQLDERVDEAEEGDESEEVSEAMELYNQKVEELEALLDSLCPEEADDCDERMLEKVEHVGFATLKHIEVLANVYDKQVDKGNENAAESILAAMEKSLNGHDKAVEAMQKSKTKEDDDTDITDHELKAGKDKAKEKLEAAKSKGKGRN